MGFSAATIGNLSLASQAAGSVTSAFGAYSQASAQRSNLRAQAAASETNARIAELAAQDELRQGERQAGQVTLQYGQLRGRQRATIAANGIALDEGSAAEIQEGTDLMRDIDRATIEVNASRAAFGQRIQSDNYRSQAAMSRANAKAISPGMAFGTSLLTSAGSVAQNWYQLKGGTPQASSGTLTGNSDPIYGLYMLNDGWR